MDITEFNKKSVEIETEWQRKVDELSKKHDGVVTNEYLRKNEELKREYNEKMSELVKQARN